MNLCGCPAPADGNGPVIHFPPCGMSRTSPPPFEVAERAWTQIATQIVTIRRELIEQGVPRDEAERYVTAIMSEMLRASWRK